jgi:hypothetical protein
MTQINEISDFRRLIMNLIDLAAAINRTRVFPVLFEYADVPKSCRADSEILLNLGKTQAHSRPDILLTHSALRVALPWIAGYTRRPRRN